MRICRVIAVERQLVGDIYKLCIYLFADLIKQRIVIDDRAPDIIRKIIYLVRDHGGIHIQIFTAEIFFPKPVQAFYINRNCFFLERIAYFGGVTVFYDDFIVFLLSEKVKL